jgi:hypothetical protein
MPLNFVFHELVNPLLALPSEVVKAKRAAADYPARILGARCICSHYAFMEKAIYSRQGACLQETLVELRQSAGLTQRQLAIKLKREHNLIGRLELGERRLDLVEFFWLCKACGADPATAAQKLMRKLEKIQ